MDADRLAKRVRLDDSKIAALNDNLRVLKVFNATLNSHSDHELQIEFCMVDHEVDHYWGDEFPVEVRVNPNLQCVKARFPNDEGDVMFASFSPKTFVKLANLVSLIAQDVQTLESMLPAMVEWLGQP
jgi:hypothetical protein